MPSTRRDRDLSRTVRRFFRRLGIRLSSRVLVGFSGGPDSMALLQALASLAQNHPLTLYAAYLDHGIRPQEERKEELTFVQQTCRSLHIPLITEAIPAGVLERQRRRQGRSLEELARQERHRFLAKTAKDLGCEYIALGHTADDQAETLIMRFFQGSGVGGLAGIPASRGKIIRPLLACSRADISRYLEENHLEFRTDSTNLAARHLRNAVRLRLVPDLDTMFPGFRRTLASFSGSMRRLHAFLEEEAERRLPWRREQGAFSIPADLFLEAPGPLRLLSLYPLLDALVEETQRNLRGAFRRIPHRFLFPVQEDEYVRKRRVILSGHGIRLRRKGNELVLEQDIVCTTKKGYLIVVDTHRRYAVPEAGWVLSCAEDQPVGGGLAVDPAGGKGPVVVRSGKPADRIRTGKGSIAISKLFTRWRIPLTERWKVPIVADSKGVLAVLGKALGYQDRVRFGLPQNILKMLTIRVDEYRVEER